MLTLVAFIQLKYEQRNGHPQLMHDKPPLLIQTSPVVPAHSHSTVTMCPPFFQVSSLGVWYKSNGTLHLTDDKLSLCFFSALGLGPRSTCVCSATAHQWDQRICAPRTGLAQTKTNQTNSGRSTRLTTRFALTVHSRTHLSISLFETLEWVKGEWMNLCLLCVHEGMKGLDHESGLGL